MSDFESAYQELFKDEGGFVVDQGGPTNFGITLKTLLALNIDLNKDGEINLKDITGMTPEQAKEFFRAWWYRYRYDLITDDRVSSKIFNLSVNMGQNQAGKIAQRALRACGVKLVEDGIVGSKTRVMINSVDPKMMMVGLCAEAAGFYRVLAALNPKKYADDLNGWLNKRAYG